LLSFGKTGLATFQFGLRQCANIVQAPKYLPSTVTNLNQAFLITSSFNGDLSNWDTSNVTDLSQMFQSASAFNNSSITGWNTSKNTSMSRMFDTCPFNQNIGGWDTSSVTDMSQTFLVSSFNQPIGSWNVSNVTNMSSMFQQNSAFNQNIGSWDVGKVTTFTQMFLLASAFNQDLGSWNVGSATTMNRMFESSSFQQDIGAWRPSKCTNFTGFLASRTLTTANYDALLTGWTDFTGAGWNNGSIASFADAGGGQVTVNTSAAHGYANNHVMRITGTTNYDGSYVISNVTLTSFRITATWVTTETGTWNATLQSGVTFGGGGSKYSVGAATTARGVLTGAPYNWTITDGGQA
jgi:surface protein